MARLAWFTPLPPVRSGIAAYNAELLPELAARHEIDVFTDPTPAGAGFHKGPASAGFSVFGAHDFLWKHHRFPYDLVVYQLGNAACHDFMWPHLSRCPGLVVLHDGQVHHERSRALLSRGRFDEYRAEFRYNHPGAPEHLPELIISTLGGSLYYLYPMLRWIVRTARLVAVHSAGLAAEIAEAHPGVEVRTIRQGVTDPMRAELPVAAAGIREQLGIPPGAVVVAAFGLVTPEKRISTGLRALASVIGQGANAYLVLAGGTTSYYHPAAEAAALGVGDRVRVSGYVPDEDLAAYIAAADVCLCLRWPTSRETSATWIRAIAAGKPTIVTDLAHTTDVPSLDPRTWQVMGMADQEAEAAGAGPVSVAVDLMDEDRSLRLALARLTSDPALREELGRSARRYWAGHHTMACAVEDYLAVIDRGRALPAPRVRDLPPHLLGDHTGLARSIAAEMGIEIDLFDSTPTGAS